MSTKKKPVMGKDNLHARPRSNVFAVRGPQSLRFDRVAVVRGENQEKCQDIEEATN